MSAVTHREILDAETLVERTHAVAVIAEAMQMDRGVWDDAGDLGRRRAARRIAWMRWLVRRGAVGEGRDG